MTHNPRFSSLWLAGALLWPAMGWSLGLGNGPASVTLGQPLDFRIPVRLEPLEVLEPECVRAEVRVGDGILLPSTLDVGSAPGSGSIRVLTRQRVDEPIVTVTLTAGCLAPVRRQYVVMADPPGLGMPAQAVSPLAVAEPPAAGSASAPALRAAAGAPIEEGRAMLQAVAPGASAPAVARSAPARPRASAIPPSSSAASPRAARPSTEPRRRASAPANAAAPAGRPRLQLDPEVPPAAATTVQPAAIQEALAAVAAAASAARAAAAAASASALRIAELEKAVEESRRQALASQSEVLHLRTELAKRSAAGSSLPPWFWPMVALLFFAGVAVAWLLWRLRGIQRTQELAWARASALVASELASVQGSGSVGATTVACADGPSTTPGAGPRTAPGTLAVAAAGAPGAVAPPRSASGAATAPSFSLSSLDQLTSIPPAPTLAGDPYPEPPTERTVAMKGSRTRPPPPGSGFGEAPRDVTIEELIDVDQQAEFFLALGQDQSAIDVLVSHLRSTGGASPLTYLKLLEIYRRVGDQAAYDRTRVRFNQRYNAYAPEWGEDLSAGRTLEDHADVVRRLQDAWTRPLDAMAELESLLFRKVDGEMFELQAYRDLLFLYAMARDRLDREEGDPDRVDLLLPLDARAPRVGAVGDARASAEIPPEDRPTAPLELDLDLTPPPRTQDSIFEPPRSGSS